MSETSFPYRFQSDQYRRIDDGSIVLLKDRRTRSRGRGWISDVFCWVCEDVLTGKQVIVDEEALEETCSLTEMEVLAWATA